MANRPMSVWLTMGPNSSASAVVSFPSRKGGRPVALDNTEIFRLKRALDRACRIIAADDGERTSRTAINLLEGTDL